MRWRGWDGTACNDTSDEKGSITNLSPSMEQQQRRSDRGLLLLRPHAATKRLPEDIGRLTTSTNIREGLLSSGYLG
jgi:hypothetical protein